MLLDLFTSSTSLAIVYGISLPTGYIITNRIGNKFTHHPFFVRFPLYIALGIVLLAPIYLLVALAAVTFLTPLFIFVASLFCVLLTRHGVSKERTGTSVSVGLLDNILPLTLFLVTTSYFALSLSYMGWPPPGDVLNAHGPFVSLIEYHGKLTLTPGIIDVVYYPQGLHVTAATFNTLTNLYPAQAVFILGASFIALIPPVIYSLIYLATSSKVFSLLAFLSVFLVHPSLNLEKWIVGYFYNGPYACLMGYLIVLTFACALTNLKLSIQKTDWSTLRKFLLLTILIVISLLITYPSFAVVITTYAAIIILIHRDQVFHRFSLLTEQFSRSNIIVKVFLIVSASILTIIFYSLVSMNWDLIAKIFPHLTMAPYSFLLSPSWFFDHINGIASIIAFICAVYQLLGKKRIQLNLLYICLMIMCILSLSATINSYILWIIMPARSIIILSVLSWPLILITIYDNYPFFHIEKNIHLSLFNRHLRLKFGNVIQMVTALVLISLFAPSLYGYVSFEQTIRWGGFTHSQHFSDDFSALEWIDKNVSCDALILNDGSFISRYILSLSVKNLTHHVLTESMFPKRARDLFMIWQNPRDMSYIIETLRIYNVSYIFSTSEEGYLISLQLEQALNEGRYQSGYFPKIYTPKKYAKIFDQYPFLKIVFKSGFTRIYRVIK
jgi:hypothetical protein